MGLLLTVGELDVSPNSLLGKVLLGKICGICISRAQVQSCSLVWQDQQEYQLLQGKGVYVLNAG